MDAETLEAVYTKLDGLAHLVDLIEATRSITRVKEILPELTTEIAYFRNWLDSLPR